MPSSFISNESITMTNNIIDITSRLNAQIGTSDSVTVLDEYSLGTARLIMSPGLQLDTLLYNAMVEFNKGVTEAADIHTLLTITKSMYAGLILPFPLTTGIHVRQVIEEGNTNHSVYCSSAPIESEGEIATTFDSVYQLDVMTMVLDSPFKHNDSMAIIDWDNVDVAPSDRHLAMHFANKMDGLAKINQGHSAIIEGCYTVTMPFAGPRVIMLVMALKCPVVGIKED